MSSEPAARADAVNRQARDAALAAAGELAVEPTSLVSFRSQGRLLIIGPYRQALAIARQLGDTLACAILASSGSQNRDGDSEAGAGVPVVFAGAGQISISGHLGEFTVIAGTAQGELNVARALDRRLSSFDLLLDLDDKPHLDFEMPPLGYYAPRGDEAATARALRELPGLIGEFDKPKFFSYDAAICAHGNSGLSGCTRCLKACPAGAIKSLKEIIEIDPYLCQGGGACASACPSGAIIYSYPQPADMQNRLRQLLRTFQDNGGAGAVLLFHDGESGSEQLGRVAAGLPGYVIPIEVEEVGSVGMDIWLAGLAFGAAQVLLLDTPQLAPSVRRELERQLETTQAILAAMGYAQTAVCLCGADELKHRLTQAITLSRPGGFAGSNEKRNTIFFAVDCLHGQAPRAADYAELPADSLFGEIRVDKQGCTLCMACVSVCPAGALEAGNDTPRLDFIESNCVQCGLCETACPEHVISRRARFDFSRRQRQQRRTLNEEAAFSCIACGKAFATRSVIEKMTAKLKGHPMFQDSGSLRRLQMCGDCRIRDMLEDENQLLS